MPRHRKVPIVEEEDSEIADAEWDIKKIMLGVGVGMIVLLTLGAYVIHVMVQKTAEWNQVLGESTRDIPQKPATEIPIPDITDFGSTVQDTVTTLSENVRFPTSTGIIQDVVDRVQQFEVAGKSVSEYYCDFLCN